MKVEIELRPCLVSGQKALFHRWVDISNVIEPSPMIGGHGGGVIKSTLGLIEYEDGATGLVHPTTIVFKDEKIKEFMF
jgi:hypothetical protein